MDVGISVMSSSEIRNRVRIPPCLPCTVGGDPWKEGSTRVEEEGREAPILRGRKSSNAELARKVLAHARFIRRRAARGRGHFRGRKRQGRLYRTGAIARTFFLFPVSSSR